MYPSPYVSVSLAAACLEAVDKQREKWFVFFNGTGTKAVSRVVKGVPL